MVDLSIGKRRKTQGNKLEIHRRLIVYMLSYRLLKSLRKETELPEGDLLIIPLSIEDLVLILFFNIY